MLLLCLSTAICQAAPADDNALAAVALYLDTSGHYFPGAEMITKALNEVIRFKVNALLLGSEVQCGNEVIRDLGRANVTGVASATADNLAEYAANRHVNYIILLSVRPLDVAIDLKTYSTASNDFIIDKSITRPDGMEARTTLDALSEMLGTEIAEVLQALRG